jgi:hypothetical protein
VDKNLGSSRTFPETNHRKKTQHHSLPLVPTRDGAALRAKMDLVATSVPPPPATPSLGATFHLAVPVHDTAVAREF